jgi:hypothetical protein
MYPRNFPLAALAATVILILTACAPQASPTPTVDAVGTMAAEMASMMLTQTAAAFVPPTVPPATDTPVPTETATPEPTSDKAPNIITVVNYTGCYWGPGPDFTLQSYINVPKDVELLGIGNVDGWYVISGPYFYSACWVSAADVEIGSNVDLTQYPVMTPGH